MKNQLVSLAFLLLPTLAFSCECFHFLLEKGQIAFNNRQFATALQKLTAARGCPDKPRPTDLEDWILRTQQNLAEQKTWNRACRADTPESYQQYLDRYPDGYYQRRADNALLRLKSSAVQPVQEILPTGNINWTEEYVEVTGQSVINRERFPNEAQAIAMATRGAEVVAKANLLETAAGVHIQRSTRIKDLMTESDIIQTQVAGLVKATRTVGEARIANGMVMVTMRMPVFGPGGVAGAVLNAPIPPDLVEELPDSIPDGPVLRLLSAAPQMTLYPSFADEQGAILLDGAAFSRQCGGEPLVRYVQIKTLPPNAHVVDITEDTNGRWVVPAAAAADFQQWMQMRRQGGGVVPIRVVM